MPTGLSAAEKAQRRKLLESGELIPAKARFKVNGGFVGQIFSWVPDQDYFIVGHSCSAKSNAAIATDFVLAVGLDPTTITMSGAFSLKTTLIEIIANPSVNAIQIAENYPSGTGYKLRQGEAVSFMVAFNGPPQTIAKGNIILKLLPLEVD